MANPRLGWSDDPDVFRLRSTHSLLIFSFLLFNAGGRRVVVMPDRGSVGRWPVLAVTRVFDELEARRGDTYPRGYGRLAHGQDRFFISFSYLLSSHIAFLSTPQRPVLLSLRSYSGKFHDDSLHIVFFFHREIYLRITERRICIHLQLLTVYIQSVSHYSICSL